MYTTTHYGTVEPLCCWLRPAPRININSHCTFTKILEAVNLQQWYPNNCHYCDFRPRHKEDYEKHIVMKHAGKMAYPGPCPEDTARALYIVQSIETELERRRKEKNKRQNRLEERDPVI